MNEETERRIKLYEYLNDKGHLSERGKDYYIDLIKGRLEVWDEKIKELLTE